MRNSRNYRAQFMWVEGGMVNCLGKWTEAFSKILKNAKHGTPGFTYMRNKNICPQKA